MQGLSRPKELSRATGARTRVDGARDTGSPRALRSRLSKHNAVRRGVKHQQSAGPAWFARGFMGGRLSRRRERCEPEKPEG